MSQPSAATPLTIRPSTDADLPAIQAIYGRAVREGTGTFETEVPAVEEMGRDRKSVV